MDFDLPPLPPPPPPAHTQQQEPPFLAPDGGGQSSSSGIAAWWLVGQWVCLQSVWRIACPLCLCLTNFCLAVTCWLWLKRPVPLYHLLLRLQAWRAGLRFRTVRLEPGGTPYRIAEKGRRPTLLPPRQGRPARASAASSLLLIHSVGDDITAWTEFARLADTELDHVIAVDLPGHGGSQVSASEDFDPSPLAARVRALLAAAGLLATGQRVHPIGYGAGACVALAYAAQWPAETELVTLAAPLLMVKQAAECNSGPISISGGDAAPADDACEDSGLSGSGSDDSDGREHSSVFEAYSDDAAFDTDLFNWLLPWELSQLPSAMRHRAYRQIGGASCGWTRRAWLASRLPRLEFHRALLANLTEEPNRSDLVERLARQVLAPVQIVVGMQDEICPGDIAQHLQRRLPNLAQTDLLDECGHSLELECPQAFYNLVYKFRRNQAIKKSA